MNELTKKRELPDSVVFTRRVFKKVTNPIVLCSVSVLLVFIVLVLDFKHGAPIYIEKVGTVIALFGVLLTIKHRFIASISSFENYSIELKGVGRFGSKDYSDEEYQEICEVVREEVLGFWMIIGGSFLSVLSLWSKIFL